jgi:hypothetical protein
VNEPAPRPPVRFTDLTGDHVSDRGALRLPWRVGAQVRRTIYASGEDGWERLIGVAVTPLLAEQIVHEHNAWLRGATPPELPGGQRWAVMFGLFQVQVGAHAGRGWTRVCEMNTTAQATHVAGIHNGSAGHNRW